MLEVTECNVVGGQQGGEREGQRARVQGARTTRAGRGCARLGYVNSTAICGLSGLWPQSGPESPEELQIRVACPPQRGGVVAECSAGAVGRRGTEQLAAGHNGGA